jgi:hypothetical protein
MHLVKMLLFAVAFAALLLPAHATNCSPTNPPIWPSMFTVTQHKWSADGNSSVVTYYDYTRGANLIIDNGGKNSSNLMCAITNSDVSS